MHPQLQTALDALSGLSYLGIFGISLLDNVVIPLPEEIFLAVLGYLLAEGAFHPVLVVLVVIAGFITSDTVLFFLGRKGNGHVIRLRDKFFKRVSFADDSVITRHMNKVIFFSRFLVQFRFLGPVLAGSYRIPYRRFFAVNLAALFVYVPLVVLLGFYFHNRIEQLFLGIGIAKNIVFVVLGVVLAIVLFSLMRTLFLKYLGSLQRKVKKALGFSEDKDI